MKIVSGILPKVLLGGGGLIAASAATPGLLVVATGNGELRRKGDFGHFGEAIEELYPRVQGGCYYSQTANAGHLWTHEPTSVRVAQDLVRFSVATDKGPNGEKLEGNCNGVEMVERKNKESLHMFAPGYWNGYPLKENTKVVVILGHGKTLNGKDDVQSLVLYCLEFNADKKRGWVEGEWFDHKAVVGKKCTNKGDLRGGLTEKEIEEKEEDRFGNYFLGGSVFFTSVDKWAWVNIKG